MFLAWLEEQKEKLVVDEAGHSTGEAGTMTDQQTERQTGELADKAQNQEMQKKKQVRICSSFLAYSLSYRCSDYEIQEHQN